MFQNIMQTCGMIRNEFNENSLLKSAPKAL